MNCLSANFEEFVLWCCNEGTYVQRKRRLLSSTREAHPACDMTPATKRGHTESQAASIVVGVVMTIIIVNILVLLCRVWQKKGKTRKKKEKEKEKKRKKREKPEEGPW